MHWGPQDVRTSGYPEELAAFASARRGGGPAVLWPEHEPPSACTTRAEVVSPSLADRLTTLLGRPVVQLASGPAVPTVVHLHAEHGDFLLLQESGASDVEVTAPAGPGHPADSSGTSLALRLLQNEVLYLPQRSRAVLRHEPGTRHLLLQVAIPPARGTV